MSDDPRLNAPATISSLHGEERNRALYARHNAGTATFMARYAPQAAKQTLFERMREALRG